jgi:two-component system chemotaxis response regulator CheB
MANRDILAIGASAGGVDALRFLASGLPRELPASVLVVLHLPPQYRSGLDGILAQAGRLPAGFAEDGQPLEKGRIYIGPPERHLLVDVDGNRIRLGSGPRENYARPAIDPLFRSTALCCAGRTVGVVLTGTLGDGASGLMALKQSGGVTVVQDPADAAFSEMPATALAQVEPEHVVGLADMPALLQRLVRQAAGAPAPANENLRYEVEIAVGDKGTMSAMDRIGRRSVLACPDCHGVLWEIEEGGLTRYRCHVGHAYAPESMAVALDENLGRALGSALRALEERVALVRKLHRQAIAQGHRRSAERWALRAEEYEKEAKLVRDSIRRVDEIAAATARAAD